MTRSNPASRTEWSRRMGAAALLLAAVLLGWLPAAAQSGPSWTLLAWNDLGMHCTDGSDFSVSSVLPPYNNLHAQLINKKTGLVEAPPAGVTVTYEAVADADLSINKTSVGKTNFWTYVQALFGVSLPPDTGLAGFKMPGASNQRQAMAFDATHRYYKAEGIPITPYDDGNKKNYYPMMRVSARDQSGNLLASTDVVLPVSDEMDCRTCHASGATAATQPRTGWAWSSDPLKDVKLNVLKRHDDSHLGQSLYAQALSARGFRPTGLYDTVMLDGKPILCDTCHSSNALPGLGYAGVPPLTQAVHGKHARVKDPSTGLSLDASSNRAACYRCHPGSETKCLRGAMGSAVAADGSLSMQCQACHGGMTAMASTSRQGWLDEPACQQCHTGTAVQNSGQIRYTSVFTSTGAPRVAANATFAVNSGTLYRFSAGHGGLQCEACHGATHAEYPASHRNDNVTAKQVQGHAGTISECTACHASVPQTTNGGPHGMHPVGSWWVGHHGDAAEHGRASCQACHGTDYRGTVLSRALADRTVSTGDYGTKSFWRGFQISCYACHNGPGSESRSPNRAPVVSNAKLSSSGGRSAALTLAGTDADRNSLTYRIVSQPEHGTVGLSGNKATYFPEAGFVGTTTFTFAAWDGSVNSNLGTVTVTASR